MRAEAHTSATPGSVVSTTLNEGRGSHLGNTESDGEWARSMRAEAHTSATPPVPQWGHTSQAKASRMLGAQ